MVTMPERMAHVAAALAFAVLSATVAWGANERAPAAQAASALGSPDYADPIKHTVKAGDTLSGIADAFGVKASAIQDANGILDPDAIRAGMVLSIPGGAAAPVPTPTDIKYTVKPGDSLSGIALTLGVSASAIQQANGVQDPDAIRVGQVLTIPGEPQTGSGAVPSPPQPTPLPVVDVKYTVKPGDTLLGLSLSFGVRSQAILEVNGLQDPNSLKAGQLITIPQGGQVGAAPAAAQPAATPIPTPVPDTKYTVKSGDTLSGIAASSGAAASAIQAANAIPDPNSLKVGQVLTIPGGTAPTPSATQAPAPPSPTIAPTPVPEPAQPVATDVPAPQPSPAAQPTPTAPPADPRSFDQTGFRIDNDRFWEYFQRRGAVRTFGYPISKEFALLGSRVQIFQRFVMQLRPDGSVTTMNLLDGSVLPYTRMNFSTFPGPDGGMAEAAPKPGSDGYFDKLLAFAKDRSPDQWSDLGVNFYKALMGTVRYEEAYPDGKQDPGIMPAINLEVWGVPISAPAFDPNNKGFVYLRFQRGIMHYDKTTGATQGLLLGEYFKAIITGMGLPPDLAEQAKGSRFYLQYNPASPAGLSRPGDLPGTDLAAAFGKDGLVVIDAGHGGTEIGAAHVFPDNVALQEKNLNLKVAQKTADILRKAGRRVVMTRTSDTQVNNPPKDVTGDGRMTLDDDLQSRVDIANNAGAQLFLSIHFNGSRDPGQNGSEVYYNAKRPFADGSKKFAQMVLDNLLATTKAAGFNQANRGVKGDEFSVGKGNSLYLLGPTDEGKPRASQMVGALAEGTFLTNDQNAANLREEKFLDAVAQGYAQAIQQYFQTIGR